MSHPPRILSDLLFDCFSHMWEFQMLEEKKKKSWIFSAFLLPWMFGPPASVWAVLELHVAKLQEANVLGVNWSAHQQRGSLVACLATWGQNLKCKKPKTENNKIKSVHCWIITGSKWRHQCKSVALISRVFGLSLLSDLSFRGLMKSFITCCNTQSNKAQERDLWATRGDVSAPRPRQLSKYSSTAFLLLVMDNVILISISIHYMQTILLREKKNKKFISTIYLQSNHAVTWLLRSNPALLFH